MAQAAVCFRFFIPSLSTVSFSYLDGGQRGLRGPLRSRLLGLGGGRDGAENGRRRRVEDEREAAAQMRQRRRRSLLRRCCSCCRPSRRAERAAGDAAAGGDDDRVLHRLGCRRGAAATEKERKSACRRRRERKRREQFLFFFKPNGRKEKTKLENDLQAPLREGKKNSEEKNQSLHAPFSGLPRRGRGPDHLPPGPARHLRREGRAERQQSVRGRRESVRESG